jgi:biopolymer transport protein ExbD
MTDATPTRFDFTPDDAAYQAKLQLAPVIDLVLFLIWFYLLVGQLVINQKDAEVALPRMSNTLTAQEVPAEFVVNLRADSAVTLDGAVVDRAELQQRLAQEQAKAVQARQPLRVVVRADRRQTYSRLEEVLRLCRSAGVAQVIFRSVEEAI